MRRKGVVYDAGCVTGVTWRPDYTTALARRELEIIKTGLHCNAVRIRARDTGRLTAAAGTALMRGIVKGRTRSRRIPAIREAMRSGAGNRELTAFLARASAPCARSSTARSA